MRREGGNHHLVVTDLQGIIVEGSLPPSSDLPTHPARYRAFPAIGGVAHTHSEYASAWAAGSQADTLPGQSACRLFPWSARLKTLTR